MTAGLFTIGKFLIGLYLGTSAVASTYGAAGSVVVLLIWVYYSAQIVLLGAEFTRAYVERFGRHGRHRSELATKDPAPEATGGKAELRTGAKAEGRTAEGGTAWTPARNGETATARRQDGRLACAPSCPPSAVRRSARPTDSSSPSTSPPRAAYRPASARAAAAGSIPR